MNWIHFLENLSLWWLQDIVYTLFYWWPWVNIIPEVFFVQTIIIYLSYLFFTYNNIYYSLLYIFCNFFFIGISLSILQLELFTAFLWLIECTVIFIFLVLLFYVNIKSSKTNLFLDFNKANVILYLSFLFFCSFFNFVEMESHSFLNFNLFYCWDDYYESFHNFVMNDLFGFTISYYIINALSFFLIGFLLLIGSVLCVTLYNYNKNARVQSYGNFLNLFDFFNNFISSIFLRKQNIFKQGNTIASTKLFSK